MKIFKIICFVFIIILPTHYAKDKKEEVNVIDLNREQFRPRDIKVVASAVNKMTHNRRKKRTVAVFSYPKMEDHMMRQVWNT